MLNALSGETRLFPILGDPIAFVKSPLRLTAGFSARGHNAACVPMLVPEAQLPDVMRGLSLIPNIGGLTASARRKREELSGRRAPRISTSLRRVEQRAGLC